VVEWHGACVERLGRCGRPVLEEESGCAVLPVVGAGHPVQILHEAAHRVVEFPLERHDQVENTEFLRAPQIPFVGRLGQQERIERDVWYAQDTEELFGNRGDGRDRAEADHLGGEHGGGIRKHVGTEPL
jgi:hypothetical protein